MNPQFDPATLPLRDIHLPDAVAWWPPALGWWLLAAGLVVVGIVLCVRSWRQRRHRAARRALNEIIRALESGAEPAGCVGDASIVLRRFAMTVGGNSGGVAGLTGEAWLEYLSEKTQDPAFTEIGRELLLDAPYRAPAQVTAEQAKSVCRVCVDWINAQPARA